MIGRIALQWTRNNSLFQGFACKVCDAEKFQKILVCPDCSEVIGKDKLAKKTAFEMLGL